MSDRTKTIWNLILGISLFSIIALGFKLFPLNKKYKKIYDRSKNIQFGTDQELENVISFLEKRLDPHGRARERRAGARAERGGDQAGGGGARPRTVGDTTHRPLALFDERRMPRIEAARRELRGRKRRGR